MNIIPLRRAALNFTDMNCLILPQNGDSKESLCYVPGNPSQLIARAASRIALDNFEDSQKRPTDLPINGQNVYATKNCREDNNESLPCTPEQQSDGVSDVPGCPAGYEALEAETRQLMCQLLSSSVGRSTPRCKASKALATMKRVTDGLLEKYRFPFNGMIKKMAADRSAETEGYVTEVAKTMLMDGKTNWGRIASLAAFGVVLCQYLKGKGLDNCVEMVGQEISTYLLTYQRDWLVKNNSWDGFVHFFREEDPETSVRNTLLGLAGFAGIGATLALLIR